MSQFRSFPYPVTTAVMLGNEHLIGEQDGLITWLLSLAPDTVITDEHRVQASILVRQDLDAQRDEGINTRADEALLSRA